MRTLFKAKAELTLQDICGKELVFPDIEVGEAPDIGETVYHEGKFADGEFTMADGKVLTITNGIITKVKDLELGYARRLFKQEVNN